MKECTILFVIFLHISLHVINNVSFFAVDIILFFLMDVHLEIFLVLVPKKEDELFSEASKQV
jgi:hypothetical protein